MGLTAAAATLSIPSRLMALLGSDWAQPSATIVKSALEDARAHLWHSAYCRMCGGFYEVQRNPENAKWRVI